MKALPILFLATALSCWVGCDRPSVKTPFTPSKPLEVVAQLSTNAMAIGESVMLDVQVYHPTDGTLQELPVRPRGKTIEVGNRGYETEPFSAEHALTRIHYELSSWELGEHIVATGSVTCVTASGEVLQEPFPEHVLNVRSVLASPNESLRDVPALRLPAKPSKLWPLFVIGVIALLAIIIALLVKRFWKRPKPQVRAVPRTPPHELALAALDQLEKKQLIEEHQYEPFYVSLSGIVRSYLEERFTLHAPEQTTEEFIRDASRSQKLSREHQELTTGFLLHCDLVKFARHEPEEGQMREALDSARQLVQETIPKPEEAAA